MADFSFVVTGPDGAGKEAVIKSLSDVFVAPEMDDTVNGLSYGQVRLSNQLSINLYATTGQERSRKCWESIAEDALGLIVLLDNTRPDPISDLSISVQNFAELIQRTAFVVGVSNLDKASHFSLQDYSTFLQYIGLQGPVLEVIPSKRKDAATLMDLLMAELEYAVLD